LLDNNIQKVDTFHRCNVSRVSSRSGAPERLVSIKSRHFSADIRPNNADKPSFQQTKIWQLARMQQAQS